MKTFLKRGCEILIIQIFFFTFCFVLRNLFWFVPFMYILLTRTTLLLLSHSIKAHMKNIYRQIKLMIEDNNATKQH